MTQWTCDTVDMRHGGHAIRWTDCLHRKIDGLRLIHSPLQRADNDGGELESMKWCATSRERGEVIMREVGCIFSAFSDLRRLKKLVFSIRLLRRELISHTVQVEAAILSRRNSTSHNSTANTDAMLLRAGSPISQGPPSPPRAVLLDVASASPAAQLVWSSWKLAALGVSSHTRVS